jgi:hypothetical protein
MFRGSCVETPQFHGQSRNDSAPRCVNIKGFMAR